MSNSKKFEKGKVNFSTSEHTIVLQNTYLNPVVKITANDNQNIHMSNIQSNQFKIKKTGNDNIIIHYIVIEGGS